MDTKERLLAKAEIPSNNSCWVFKNTGVDGYGRFWLDGRTPMAHRVSYELFVGDIPSGYQVDRRCRNRACINPAHLEPVPPSENQRRANSNSTFCKNGLHEWVEENWYFYPSGAKACSPCRIVSSKKIISCDICGKEMLRKHRSRHLRTHGIESERKSIQERFRENK